MKAGYNSYSCAKCDQTITGWVFDYSNEKFQLPLCQDCQVWYRNLKGKPSNQSKKLYLALKERGLDVELEYFDGFKKIDIFSKESMIHIEIDGEQHYKDTFQASSDLLRTMYSYKEGFITLRIPNTLVSKKLDYTAEIVYRILMENRGRKQPTHTIP
jgi:very-short-patch-repair endonuclease